MNHNEQTATRREHGNDTHTDDEQRRTTSGDGRAPTREPTRKQAKPSRTGHRAYRRHRAECLAPDHLVCHLCQRPIDKTLTWPHPLSATADHLEPVGTGGDNLGELAPAHKRCNESRGTLTPEQWRARRAAAAPPAQATRPWRW